MLHKILGEIIESIKKGDSDLLKELDKKYWQEIRNNHIPEETRKNYNLCYNSALDVLDFPEKHDKRLEKAREMFKELPVV